MGLISLAMTLGFELLGRFDRYLRGVLGDLGCVSDVRNGKKESRPEVGDGFRKLKNTYFANCLYKVNEFLNTTSLCPSAGVNGWVNSGSRK